MATCSWDYSFLAHLWNSDRMRSCSQPSAARSPLQVSLRYRTSKGRRPRTCSVSPVMYPDGLWNKTKICLILTSDTLPFGERGHYLSGGQIYPQTHFGQFFQFPVFCKHCDSYITARCGYKQSLKFRVTK